MKCDIVIPIYNHLEWVKLCVKSIFSNTNISLINKIYLIDDCSSIRTRNGLKELENKYGDKIKLIFNKKNQGFVKNCNYAFKNTSSEYILLLNSDCLLSLNSLEKMMNAMKKDSKIGLMCPISSKASNLSFPLKDGLNYQILNKLFEEQFNEKTFDACTVTGNCLMISRKCIDKIGYFDEIFEKGYAEETEYQFRAMKNGFKSKVLIDTYVFHEARVSFGEADELMKSRDAHLKIFFDRWENEYNALHEKYLQNDPINYIINNLKLDGINYDIKYKLSKNVSSTEIDTLNDMIIQNNSVKILVDKRNKSWENYNTLFVPTIINKKIKIFNNKK